MLNLEVGEVHNLLSNNNLGRLNNNIASRRRNEATPMTIGHPGDDFIRISIMDLQGFLPAFKLMKTLLLGEHSHGHHSFGVPIQLKGSIKI